MKEKENRWFLSGYMMNLMNSRIYLLIPWIKGAFREQDLICSFDRLRKMIRVNCETWISFQFPSRKKESKVITSSIKAHATSIVQQWQSNSPLNDAQQIPSRRNEAITAFAWYQRKYPRNLSRGLYRCWCLIQSLCKKKKDFLMS